MNELGAMRTPFRASLDDAKHLISRRLLVGVLLASVTLLVAVLIASYTRNPWTVVWIAAPGLWAVGALYYADTMRLIFLPQYKLNMPQIQKLLSLTLITLGLAVLCALSLGAAIAWLPVAPQMLKVLHYVILYVLITYFGTKLAFACYALKDRGVLGACARSWMLTTGTAFLPALLAMAAFYGGGILVASRDDAVRAALSPWAYATFYVSIHYAYFILAGAFVYPFLARWMVESEVAKDPSPVVPSFTER